MDRWIRCFQNLGRRRFRSFLTIAGIAIGVASVVLIGSIGETGKTVVSEELHALGVDGITIGRQGENGAVLTQKELDIVRQEETVQQAVPLVMEYRDVQMRKRTSKSVLWGIDAGENQAISLELVHGRFITQQDIQSNANVCLVDETTAEAYYGRANIVGKVAHIPFEDQTVDVTIVGVVRSGGVLMQNFVSEMIPNFFYFPYTTLQSLAGKDSFDQIMVQIQEDCDPQTAGEALVAALETMNDGSGYTSQNMAQQADILNDILDMVTLILSLIAGISLLVAGLSIMTVMLVSVHERTREIGIKKSIGAGHWEIMKEFLAEALVISALGSFVGVAIGLLIIWMGGQALQITPTIHWVFIRNCMLFAVGIGMIFGVYPAYQAANLRPVEALRNDG